MNCNCLQLIKEAYTGGEIKGKKITDAYVKEHGIFARFDKDDFDGFFDETHRTYSTIEVFLEGRKTPKKIKRSHDFCPFCGIEIAPEVEPKTKKECGNVTPAA